MALNKDFRVKDSLYVGASGYFTGNPGNNISIDTGGRILSAGSDLFDIFSEGDITAVCTTSPWVTGGGDTGQVTVGIQHSCATNWDTTYTTVNNKKDQWDDVYSDWDALSGALINGGSSYDQGTITLSGADDTTITTIDTGLQTTDTPTFVGVCATSSTSGFISAGRDLADIFVDSVTAGNGTITIDGTSANPTVRIADACVTALSSSFCAATCASQGTTTLTSLDGTTATLDIGLQTDDNVIFNNVNSTAGLSGNNVTIGSAAAGTICTVNSENLILNSDGSCVEVQTNLNVTSNGQILSAGQDLSSLFSIGDITAVCTTSPWVTGGGSEGQVTVGIEHICATNWDGVYSDWDALSGALINGASSYDQGTITLSGADDTTITTLDTGLQTTDTPTFAGVCATDTTNGFVSAGRDLAEIFATSASGVTGSGSEYKLAAWSGGTPTNAIADSIVCMNSACSKVTVGGDHLVTGNSTIYGNLSVTGDFTCIETIVTTTSALSVLNDGTGPALYVQQAGNQPIAWFIDEEGGDIVFNNDGYVGIGTCSPGDRLTVVGNISGGGDLTITNNAAISGTIANTGLVAGTTDTVVIADDASVLQKRTINDRVWGTTLVDNGGSNLTGTYIPKASDCNTITNSSISDSGSEVIVHSSTFSVSGCGEVRYCAASSTIHTRESIFNGTVGTTSSNITTFPKSGFVTGKYVVTLKEGTQNITSFELLANYNGTTGDTTGTVYAINDAQDTSLLGTVVANDTGSTVNLCIGATCDNTTVIIQGTGLYTD